MTQQEHDNAGWLPDVIWAMKESGGTANLPSIYNHIRAHRTDLPDEWEAVVRATIYAHSTDSPAYQPANPNVFYKVRRGVWGLRHPDLKVFGRSEEAMWAAAVASLSVEEFQAAAATGPKFLETVEHRRAELRRTLGMPQA